MRMAYPAILIEESENEEKYRMRHKLLVDMKKVAYLES